MEIGYKLYDTADNFSSLELEMALTCIKNGWCMEEEQDENGKRYLVINRPKKESEEEKLIRAKQKKIEELKAERDNAEIQPIEYDDNTFDYDEKSRDRLAIARQTIEDGAIKSIEWTTAINTRVTLTLTDFIGINTAAALRSNELHIKYNQQKQQVLSCNSKEELMSL